MACAEGMPDDGSRSGGDVVQPEDERLACDDASRRGASRFGD
jgi:hypothetical protein